MNQDQREKHAVQVDAWIDQTTKGLPSERLVPLFVEAIHAFQKRILITLSEVTFTAVFDRVLHQSQKKFPLLSGMKIEPKEISLDGILSQINSHKPAEITEAFRFFLIELLTILGNLTAGILTEPLYKELSKVTGDRVRAQSEAGPQISNHRKTSTDREDV